MRMGSWGHSAPQGSFYWNWMGRVSHIYMIQWQVNLQRCEHLLNKTQTYSILWRLLGLVEEWLVGSFWILQNKDTVKMFQVNLKLKKKKKKEQNYASSPELAIREESAAHGLHPVTLICFMYQPYYLPTTMAKLNSCTRVHTVFKS